ncbi:MAG: methyl-accepting chemotaxis protein, partial [Pseudomonadota bacterium]
AGLGLSAAAAILERDLPGFDVVWSADGQVERVIMDQGIPAAFEDHGMIDAVGRVTGETATLFGWDTESGDFWRRTTNIVKPDGNRAVGTPLGTNGAVFPVLRDGNTFFGEAVILGLPYYTVYEPVFDASGDVNGILYVGVRKDVIAAKTFDTVMGMVIAALIGLVLVAGAAVFVMRRMTRPLPVIAEVVEKIAEGDHEVSVPFVDHGDEIGAVARAVEVLREASTERAALSQASEEEAEERTARQKRLEELVAGFRATVTDVIGSVRATTESLDGTARKLTDVAQETTHRSGTVAENSSVASQNVQTAAAAAEELSASIGEISRQLAETTGTVGRATETVSATNVKVESLAQGAQKIGDVVKLISEIAEQTNLLALNATIEAARAGEAGKGFAVVASEVKSLASQTARATEEIGTQVGAIQSSTTEAVDAIRVIGEIINDVNQTTASIAAAVEEQGSATDEISRSVTDAASGTSTVAEHAVEVNAAADQTNSSAADVLTSVETLAAESERLGEAIDSFLTDVAA